VPLPVILSIGVHVALSPKQAITAALMAKVLTMAEGQISTFAIKDFVTVGKDVCPTEDDLRFAAQEVTTRLDNIGTTVTISVIRGQFKVAVKD
jgi:hypothetical protein